jgi:diadenosine tetraphosphate (Ap4A) HIT family hydrolase
MSISPAQPECPFCRQNNLLDGEVLASSDKAYAIESKFTQNCYLIIPEDHVESLTDLPDNWWGEFKAVLSQLTMHGDYNLSLNYGRAAGQTLKHLHFWVIPRTETGHAGGKGLARLIQEVDQRQ